MSDNENITRAEAADRSALLHSHSYEALLDLTQPGDTFISTTTATFDCRTPGESSWIDLIAP